MPYALLLSMLLGAPRQLAEVALTDYRLTVEIVGQVFCLSSPNDPFYADRISIVSYLTNLSDEPLSFFEGDHVGVLVFDDMNRYRAGTPSVDASDSFYPETIAEGRRYVVRPGATDRRESAVGIIVSRDRAVTGIKSGRRIMQIQIRRRRLSSVDEIARSGQTRTWVRMVSQPVEILIPEPAGSLPCRR